jgi:hypothetical protein
MPPPSPDREALIAALAEQARSDVPAGPDPEPEELLDYLAGRLAPEDEQRVARLLVASPDAARSLLDLADLEEAGATAGERPAELATRAGWRDLQTQLSEAAPRPPRPPAWLSAVAASLLVANLGLGSWVWRLEGKLDRPVANLRSLELPSGSRASSEKVVELPQGAPLRLVLAPAERCPSYAAELEGPRPGDRQPIEGLERDEGGLVTLLLPGDPGLYRLRLAGCEPRRALEEHRFRIVRAHGG